MVPWWKWYAKREWPSCSTNGLLNSACCTTALSRSLCSYNCTRGRAKAITTVLKLSSWWCHVRAAVLLKEILKEHRDQNLFFFSFRKARGANQITYWLLKDLTSFDLCIQSPNLFREKGKSYKHVLVILLLLLQAFILVKQGLVKLVSNRRRGE